MRFRGDNPVYKRFDYEYSGTAATYGGVARKTMWLLLLVASVAIYTSSYFLDNLSMTYLLTAFIGAPIFAFIMVMLAHRNIEMSWLYSMMYALFEGVFIGAFTSLASLYIGVDGIIYVIYGTFGTLFVMLILYSTRLIKVSNGFMSFLITSLVTIVFIGLIFFILSFFTPFTGLTWQLYLTFAAFSTLISALFLLYDFRRIEDMVSAGANKQYEWSLGLGLVTTIVWIYIELLRLAIIIFGRD